MGQVTAKRGEPQEQAAAIDVRDIPVADAVAAGLGGVQPEQERRDTGEGNPGQGDPDAGGDVDLSTSDTTIRRKAGVRRDNGIRI